LKIISIITLCLSLFVGNSLAQEFYPSNILMMDEKFSHHVLLVEKSTHKLHLYENNASSPKLVKTFSTATGKFKGNKAVAGDHKTPEGIYTIHDFLSKEELLKRHGKYAEIYGSGAFPMNYPNFMDERAGKTGNGIWLHSTDDDNRISKGLDSRGCVVVQNADLKELSQYIDLDHTPIIVVQDIFFLSKSTWEKNRKDISDAVSKWAKAWQAKDFDTYIGSYDAQSFFDRSRGNYNSYKNYKKAVFSRPDSPVIKFDFISIMSTDQYAVVHLQQDYRSNVINDIGKKTLYLKKDSNYDWKIIGELWSKADQNRLAFTPGKRFFKE
jgi:murein L,D-transpeptidase YafK